MNGYSIRVAEAVRRADGNLLGAQLGRVCIDQDIPVMEVAAEMKVSRQTVYSWFLGRAVPASKHVPMIEEFIRLRSSAT
jgi:hypothetical protein